jgi:hypothetical protein
MTLLKDYSKTDKGSNYSVFTLVGLPKTTHTNEDPILYLIFFASFELIKITTKQFKSNA